MILVFILGILIAGFFVFINNLNNDLVIIVNSKYNTNNYYVVVRKSDKNGYNVNHWEYYDNKGNIIYNHGLINFIYDSFKDEDWYGDYTFYVNDKMFHINKKTKIKNISDEMKIVDTIKEMEESLLD